MSQGSRVPRWVWWGLAGGIILGVLILARLARGIRNNNPMNLRPLPGGKTWDGEIAPDRAKGGPFSRYITPAKGWRAGGIDVFGDILTRGQNTIRRLVGGTPEAGYKDAYAPASDNNNVQEYIAALTKALGVADDQPLSIGLHGPELLHAIGKHENGIDPDLVWGEGPRKEGTLAALQRWGYA